MRVYHYHIQKTCGTSVNYAIFSLAYDPAMFPDGFDRDHPGKVVYRSCVRKKEKIWVGNEFKVAHFNRETIQAGEWHFAHPTFRLRI